MSDRELAALGRVMMKPAFEAIAAKHGQLPDITPEEAEAAHERREAEYREKRRDAALAAFVEQVGRRYADCTLDSFKVRVVDFDDGTLGGRSRNEVSSRERASMDGAVTCLRKYCDDITRNIKSGRGVVLFGAKGTGKDHLMVSVLKAAVMAGHRVVWRNGMDVYREITSTWNKSSDATESATISVLAKAPVLAISDPIPPIGELKEHEARALFSIIDERYRECLPTLITANFTDTKDAEQRMSGQIVDRLKDGALAIHCNWPSYRKSLEA